mgnify:CR=1 FL=1
MPVQIARITEVIRETPRITTLRFDLEMKAAPNQYVMVWIPGVDEKPLSLSYIGEKCGVTALAQGPFTKSFCERKEELSWETKPLRATVHAASEGTSASPKSP